MFTPSPHATRWTAPVRYFCASASAPCAETTARSLWEGLGWQDRGAPRREAFYSTLGKSYTYGSGAGRRTYVPEAFDGLLLPWKAAVEDELGVAMELCFTNGYSGARDHLGWHADDSPEVDPARPIAVVSFGAPREIWFKPREGGPDTVEKCLLEPGSLLVMEAGMQATHLHRIPKHSAPCSFRVSLTFRGATPA